jgi:uncharacterized MAPEG superfamily protein
MTPATSLIASAGLTFGMLLVASLARSRGWTPSGLKIAFGNRDDLPEASPFVGRAERAARNMVENLVLFAALLTAAAWVHVPDAELASPCAIFVYARLLYAPLYWVGVKYLRTAVWTVSIVALFNIARLVLA